MVSRLPFWVPCINNLLEASYQGIGPSSGTFSKYTVLDVSAPSFSVKTILESPQKSLVFFYTCSFFSVDREHLDQDGSPHCPKGLLINSKGLILFFFFFLSIYMVRNIFLLIVSSPLTFKHIKNIFHFNVQKAGCGAYGAAFVQFVYRMSFSIGICFVIPWSIILQACQFIKAFFT